MPELTEPSEVPLDPSQKNADTPRDDTTITPESDLPVPQNLPALSSTTAEAWPSVESRSISRNYTTRRRLPVSLWLVALLIPYAIVATIGVAYLFQQRLQMKTPHILESIPDQGLYEDFLDGRRREVIQTIDKAGNTATNTKIIPPNEPIDQEMPAVKLGETRRVGQLEVTPLSVVKQKLRYAWRDGKSNVEGDEALVMQLQVKNVGPLIFRPDDETFNRAFANDSKSPVYTFLEGGHDRYFGAIVDPVRERLTFPVCSSLLPGETGIITVVALRSGDGRKLAVNALKTGETCLWRVHLRRGKEDISLSTGKKRSVWLTTIVPVKFSQVDVK